MSFGYDHLAQLGRYGGVGLSVFPGDVLPYPTRDPRVSINPRTLGGLVNVVTGGPIYSPQPQALPPELWPQLTTANQVRQISRKKKKTKKKYRAPNFPQPQLSPVGARRPTPPPPVAPRRGPAAGSPHALTPRFYRRHALNLDITIRRAREWDF